MPSTIQLGLVAVIAALAARDLNQPESVLRALLDKASDSPVTQPAAASTTTGGDDVAASDDPFTNLEIIEVTFHEEDGPLLLQLGGGARSTFFAEVLNFPKGPDGEPGQIQLCDKICLGDGIAGVAHKPSGFEAKWLQGGKRMTVIDRSLLEDHEVASYDDVLQELRDLPWPKTIFFSRTAENGRICAEQKAERDARCAADGNTEKCIQDYYKDNTAMASGTEKPMRADGTAGNDQKSMKMKEWEQEQEVIAKLQADQARMEAAKLADSKRDENFEKAQAESVLAE